MSGVDRRAAYSVFDPENKLFASNGFDLVFYVSLGYLSMLALGLQANKADQRTCALNDSLPLGADLVC